MMTRFVPVIGPDAVQVVGRLVENRLRGRSQERRYAEGKVKGHLFPDRKVLVLGEWSTGTKEEKRGTAGLCISFAPYLKDWIRRLPGSDLQGWTIVWEGSAKLVGVEVCLVAERAGEVHPVALGETSHDLANDLDELAELCGV